jgi:hypothetical protein
MLFFIALKVIKFLNNRFLYDVCPAVSFILKSKKLVEKTKEEMVIPFSVCEVGLEQEFCGPNQVCQARNSKSRNGLCQCKDGFLPAATPDEGCLPINLTVSTPPPVFPIGKIIVLDPDPGHYLNLFGVCKSHKTLMNP